MNKEEQMEAIDGHIFENLIMTAIRAIRTLKGATLRDALWMLYARYDRLRATHPGRFTCSHADYWEGFYS
jgi:hypothetical protein